MAAGRYQPPSLASTNWNQRSELGFYRIVYHLFQKISYPDKVLIYRCHNKLQSINDFCHYHNSTTNCCDKMFLNLFLTCVTESVDEAPSGGSVVSGVRGSSQQEQTGRVLPLVPRRHARQSPFRVFAGRRLCRAEEIDVKKQKKKKRRSSGINRQVLQEARFS